MIFQLVQINGIACVRPIFHIYFAHLSIERIVRHVQDARGFEYAAERPQHSTVMTYVDPEVATEGLVIEFVGTENVDNRVYRF